MKATGIVRRIDELGRVVIPKEIRRTIRLREGDPVEIFVNNDTVILKKYSPIGGLSQFAKQFAESLVKSVGHVALITDRDAVIALSGTTLREYIDKMLSPDMENLMINRQCFQDSIEIHLLATMKAITSDEDDGAKYTAQTIVPIISEGEPIGLVILLSTVKGATMGEPEMKSAKIAANFMGKQVEG